jgi:NAD(P)H-dependent FMN reductase
MTTYKVGYFVGSLSSTSINRVLSKALIRLAPEDMEFTEIPIGNLPLYSPDYDANYPPEATALKEAIAAVDAVLFVTPEYNRSIPGALKNVISVRCAGIQASPLLAIGGGRHAIRCPGLAHGHDQGDSGPRPPSTKE